MLFTIEEEKKTPLSNAEIATIIDTIKPDKSHL